MYRKNLGTVSGKYPVAARTLLRLKSGKELTKEMIESLIRRIYVYQEKKIEVQFPIRMNLMVGVLTEEFAVYLKGKKPYISLEERMEIVKAIRYVDEVVPVDFHNTIKPDAWKLYHFDCCFQGMTMRKKKIGSGRKNCAVWARR